MRSCSHLLCLYAQTSHVARGSPAPPGAGNPKGTRPSSRAFPAKPMKPRAPPVLPCRSNQSPAHPGSSRGDTDTPLPTRTPVKNCPAGFLQPPPPPPRGTAPPRGNASCDNPTILRERVTPDGAAAPQKGTRLGLNLADPQNPSLHLRSARARLTCVRYTRTSRTRKTNFLQEFCWGTFAGKIQAMLPPRSLPKQGLQGPSRGTIAQGGAGEVGRRPYPRPQVQHHR